MAKILEINVCNFASTGNIMLEIKKKAETQGNTVFVSYPKSRSNMKKSVDNALYIGSIIGRNLHLLLSYVTGLNGCFSYLSTLRFLRRVSQIAPDIIHLHNLHNCYINIPLLFRYIKKHRIPVIWTLHDCWSFTGQCAHFTMAGCDKWKTGCHHCPQYREYPAAMVDRTQTMWKRKKKWFTGVEDLTIVTPSQWLADLVKQSFLKAYPVKVINNGIDLSIFRPSESDFRKKYGIPQDRHILLGVASSWETRKGADVFAKLANRLGRDFQIVLVGTNDTVDQQLPKNIISIHRTYNRQELAEIYTVADVFVNPTREENYPTVNMEAIACGTPVVTFRTGGSPEILDETCGSVVACDDVDALEKEIVRICQERPYSQEACLARAKIFDMNDRFEEYVRLYETAVDKRHCSGL